MVVSTKYITKEGMMTYVYLNLLQLQLKGHDWALKDH